MYGYVCWFVCIFPLICLIIFQLYILRFPSVNLIPLLYVGLSLFLYTYYGFQFGVPIFIWFDRVSNCSILYNLASCQVCARAVLGFWANLALYGRLLINKATGQVGGYGFGQVLTKHMIFGIDIPQYDGLWYTAMVTCASEQTRAACTPRFPSPKC